jgi:hypothetical protein
VPKLNKTIVLMLLAVGLLPLACSRKNTNPLSPALNTSSATVPGVKVIQDSDTLYCTDLSRGVNARGINQYLVNSQFNGTKGTGDFEYQCGGSGSVNVNFPAGAGRPFLQVLANGVGNAAVGPGSYGLSSDQSFSYLRLYGYGPDATNSFFYYSPTVGKSATLVSDALGVGGAAGDYKNDFYIRWQGHKVGANTSFDYANITFYFNSPTSPHMGNDISHYHGFSFYARGKGNFGVGLTAGSAGGPPYKDYNVFEVVFGDELIDENRWRQIVIYFPDMRQLYLGKGYVNINTVLANTSGIQFQQETPVTQNFVLDLDYIRFF